LALLGLSLGLSACISLPFGKGDERPAPVMYSLHQPASAAMEIATEAAGRIVVVVPTPELAPGLDAERIAIRFEDGRVDYYADAQWSARLDILIHDVFLERAQRKLPGTIVGKPGLVPAANYRLVLKVTDFGPVYQTSPDMPPQLNVGLSLTVIELPQDVVRAQFIVEKIGAASENRLGAITTELRVTLDSVLDEALGKAAAYISEPQNVVRSNSAAINQSAQR
jgi:ABC-type uncharacterized transport system auxiliary subunit